MSHVVDAVNVCLSILIIKVHPLSTHYLEGKKTGVVDTQVGSTVVKREQTVRHKQGLGQGSESLACMCVHVLLSHFKLCSFVSGTFLPSLAYAIVVSIVKATLPRTLQ